MSSMDKKLKISFLGFDWNDIGIDNIDFIKSKLNRDRLQTSQNEFLLLYAGNTIKRKKFGDNFLVWHFTLFFHLRIFYDIFFIIFFPIILIFEQYRPDIFYSSDFPFVLASILPAKILKSKIIFRLNNLPRELALTKGVKGIIFSMYYWLIEKIVIKFIDSFVVINDTTKKYLMDLGVKEERIFTDIPNTILRDKEYIKSSEKEYIRKKHNISADQKIILSIGSLIKEKGYLDLIKTFAELKRKDLILIIIGNGPQKNELKSLVHDLDIVDNVIFAGSIKRDEIWSYFIGSDIFILFSKSESLGMVFWEAMYVNLPIIGTAVGGVKETIGNDGERGFFFRNDINDLSKKISFCLDDSDKKEEMLKKARKYVEDKLKNSKTINKIFN